MCVTNKQRITVIYPTCLMLPSLKHSGRKHNKTKPINQSSQSIHGIICNASTLITVIERHTRFFCPLHLKTLKLKLQLIDHQQHLNISEFQNRIQMNSSDLYLFIQFSSRNFKFHHPVVCPFFCTYLENIKESGKYTMEHVLGITIQISRTIRYVHHFLCE